MIVAKIIKSLLGKDEKPYLNAVEEEVRKSLANPTTKPSLFTRFVWLRHRLYTRRVEIARKIGLHPKIWLLRLKISKEIQRVRYRSFHSKRRWRLFGFFCIGIVFGDIMSNAGRFPGHENWTDSFLTFPRIHWVAPYLIEDTFVRNIPDYYKKDKLAQAIDTVVRDGIDEGLDPLTWLTISTYFASAGDNEFSYLGYHMAHLKDHEKIGTNSLQPIEFEEATSIITSK